MAEFTFEDWVKKQYTREYEKCTDDYDALSSKDKKEYRNDLYARLATRLSIVTGKCFSEKVRSYVLVSNDDKEGEVEAVRKKEKEETLKEMKKRQAEKKILEAKKGMDCLKPLDEMEREIAAKKYKIAEGRKKINRINAARYDVPVGKKALRFETLSEGQSEFFSWLVEKIDRGNKDGIYNIEKLKKDMWEIVTVKDREYILLQICSMAERPDIGLSEQDMQKLIFKLLHPELYRIMDKMKYISISVFDEPIREGRREEYEKCLAYLRAAEKKINKAYEIVDRWDAEDVYESMNNLESKIKEFVGKLSEEEEGK